jgi:pseudouridine-5'-phosphate glycosidase
MFKQYLDILPEVVQALQNNQPVVALESTIISHGMPYPQNVEMANEVENIIRSHGAIPATIAILNGRLKVGLTASELELLATSKDIIKASRRDLAFLVSQKKHGATTVASTMIIAALADIKVFATGGIGGVHRGAETSFDISADLLELATTNVAVVCAGAKSILDIGLTLEYLETHGVPVVGYQTKELPAFYTSSSGFEVDYKLDTPKEIAQSLKTKWDLNLNGGVVIANPIPKAYEMDASLINSVIAQALQQQDQLGIKGKESTPFLLSKVKELTGGDSLSSNIQLVYNNAHLAAQIAVEFSKL